MIKLIVNHEGVSNIDRFYEVFLDFDSIKEDQNRYPHSIFAFKKDKFIWEFNKKTGNLWISYSKIWLVLEKDYGLDYKNIHSFVKHLLEKHFKHNNIKLQPDTSVTPLQLEECFKDNNITVRIKRPDTLLMLEEYFKNNNITVTITSYDLPHIAESLEKHFKNNNYEGD